MKVVKSVASIIAFAGLACSAMAQDSVSNKYNGTQQSGLPGDGLSPWTLGAPYQKAAYAVDLTKIYTSCGYRFGIAPLIKTSKTGSAFFGSLVSAQSLSQTTLANLSNPASGTYAEWVGLAGYGVHPVNNTAAPSVAPIAWTPYGFNQFGATLAEFATDDAGKSVNNVITAVVNYAPERPNRLWVDRIVSAVNESASGVGDSSQFGIGGVDNQGIVAIRADNFGATGPNQLTGNNYYRVRSLSRNPAKVGLISSVPANGDAAATDGVRLSQTSSHNTPTLVPSDLATAFSGGLAYGRLIGSNFDKNYVYETALNSTAVTAVHRTGTADHRGGVTFSQVNLFGGVGTAAIIGKSTTASGDPADRVCVWGVNANATVGTQYTLSVPFSISDGCYTSPSAWDGLGNYLSQTSARGANGQIAVGKDQAGRGLLAGFVSSNRSSIVNPFNALAVCRFDTASPVSSATWKLAAWVDTANFDGKPIKGDFGQDGIAFTNDLGEFDGVCDANDGYIGRLASMSEYQSSGLAGPSMSNPVFDSVGNIWFLSVCALYKSFGTDFDTCLVRAVYNPATFCYDLELVMELGDTFDGLNSGTKYQVQFLEIADSNSISSATLFSSNGTQGAWNNLDPTAFASTTDTRALGGLVLGAKIVYDVDGDGDFEDPTRTNGNVTSPDEAYQVLLYIGNTSHGCLSDFNGDNFVTGDDFDQFVIAFEAGDSAADVNLDGFVTGDDFDQFVIAYEAGC